MWLLHLLPESIILILVYSMLAVGFIGLIATSFLRSNFYVNLYRIPLQLLCVVILASGLYWYGGYSTEMLWRAEVAKLEEKVKESKILDLNQELDEEENIEAIDEAFEIVNKLDREFKNSYANLLMEVIASEFNGYNYTSISDEFGQIAQDETDYFEVVSLMLKKNAAHVLQEMCKTHQNSITRRLVAVAMNTIVSEKIEGTAEARDILNICINSITKAKDFSKIDCYVLSELCLAFNNPSRWPICRWRPRLLVFHL